MTRIAEGTPLPEPPPVPLDQLEAFMRAQRWFSSKSRTIKSLAIKASVSLGPAVSAGEYLALMVEAAYTDGVLEDYFVPLRVSGSGLVDGLEDEACCRRLFSVIENEETIAGQRGTLDGRKTSLYTQLRGAAVEVEPLRPAAHDQSNSAILLGSRLFLKIFRRVEPGLNPDLEIAWELTQQSAFTRFPRLAGVLELAPNVGVPLTLATLQEQIVNDGSAWDAMLQRATTFLKDEAVGDWSNVALLGQRTAELHLALAAETCNPAFAPEPMTIDDCEVLAARLRRTSEATFKSLKDSTTTWDAATKAQISDVLTRGPQLVEQFCDSLAIAPSCSKTRVHGDYHLGQVLCQANDFIILDFEGEPARSLAERRAKDCPLRDVAGMLRSFDYAAYAALFALAEKDENIVRQCESRARRWQAEASAAYQRGYNQTAAGAAFLPQDTRQFNLLRDFFIVEKALYELQYELNNRPAWLKIPLAGILSIADSNPPNTGD